MGSRGNGWRASFSPSVDSVTHPWAGTQTRHTSISLIVISNKRIIIALVKSTPTILCLLSLRSGSHSAWITWPGGWNLSSSQIENAQCHYSSFYSNHFSIWLSSNGLWRRMSECADMCFYMYLYEWAAKRGREMGADVYLNWQDNSVSPFY